METVLIGLSGIIGLVSLGCWIFTIVRAFQAGDTTSGILCICPLIGLIIGWMNHTAWNHTKVMMIWTACVIFNILMQVVAIAVMGGQAAAAP